MANPNMVARSYLACRLEGAPPLERIVVAYDAALAAFSAGNCERALRAITLLRDSLDFERAPEVALGLFRLYQYCGDLARQDRFDEALPLLRDLRNAWAQARDGNL